VTWDHITPPYRAIVDHGGHRVLGAAATRCRQPPVRARAYIVILIIVVVSASHVDVVGYRRFDVMFVVVGRESRCAAATQLGKDVQLYVCRWTERAAPDYVLGDLLDGAVGRRNTKEAALTQ
jgi:hypothetical protein